MAHGGQGDDTFMYTHYSGSFWAGDVGRIAICSSTAFFIALIASQRVVVELLGRGRLRLVDILRATRLRSQVIANALLILIQHNIVWHCESETGIELFEINWNEILHRLRYGRYLSISRELFGEEVNTNMVLLSEIFFTLSTGL